MEGLWLTEHGEDGPDQADEEGQALSRPHASVLKSGKDFCCAGFDWRHLRLSQYCIWPTAKRKTHVDHGDEYGEEA